jgi:methionine synthase / methylenetetrahydrofolate reductase(NADPH)
MGLLEQLQQGTVLADGAMGTMLHAAGVSMNACFDKLNLSDPALVADVHRAYIAAGANLIETNTFGANRYKLIDHGCSNQVSEINAAAVNIARAVVDELDYPVFVAGAVGPLGVRLAPFGRVQPEQAFEAFREQIAALIEAGVDAIILETHTDVYEIVEAIRAARDVNPAIPVIASMTFTRDDRTLYGDSPRDVAQKLIEAGADVIGVNCSGGPSQLARIAGIMVGVARGQNQRNVYVSVMPNAGFPELIGGRLMYPATPEYFAEYAVSFRQSGVSVIGGCCGTTPDHIRAMRAALDAPQRASIIQISTPYANGDENGHTAEAPTELARKLSIGKFVTTVEMAPPRSFTAQKVLASAQMLSEAGVDMINVSDSPMARMRMSPWAVCHLVQNTLGMETVLHFPTRGRNLLRVQGDLLAAHALHVRNIFVVMGDPTAIGDYPNANDNYDIVPSGLIQLIKKNLNAGQDQAGNSIGAPTSFHVGCALNMGAPDLDKEIKTLVKKIEAGADFALTQTIYDPAVVERFLKRYEELYGALKLPILAGMLPLYGARHAAFLHNEVPGIVIPDDIRARIDAAGEVAPSVGVAIARELLRDLRGMVQGAYLMPPFGKYEMAAEIVEGLAEKV